MQLKVEVQRQLSLNEGVECTSSCGEAALRRAYGVWTKLMIATCRTEQEVPGRAVLELKSSYGYRRQDF